MENQNFIQGNESDAVATVVIRELADQNFVTREMEDEAADRWERMNGRLLRRSYETQEEWDERKATQEGVSEHRSQFVMSPDRAKAELKRLERTTRSYAPSPEEASQMNELRVFLGVPPVAYLADVLVPSEDEEHAAKVEKSFVTFATWTEKKRLDMVSRLMKDPVYLGKVATCDESEEVRNAALAKLGGAQVERE